MTTNRILPETLLALYTENDVLPDRGLYIAVENDGTRLACGLGVSCWAALGTEDEIEDMDSDDAADILGLSPDYALGYQHGWDGELVPHRALDAFDLGYADGAAGWDAVKDLAVTR